MPVTVERSVYMKQGTAKEASVYIKQGTAKEASEFR